MITSLVGVADRATRLVAVLLLLSLLGCVFLGVVFRQLNMPLAWSDELAQSLLVWTGFVGWVIAARKRSHIRIGVIADKLPPLARRVLEVLIQLSIIIFAMVLLRYSFGIIDRTWDVESVTLPVSTAILYVPIPLAALALILQAMAETGEALRGNIKVQDNSEAQPL